MLDTSSTNTMFFSDAEVDTVMDAEPKIDPAKVLPYEFLYEDASRCSPVDNLFSCSAVVPSLPLAISCLRDCVKRNPAVRIQVNYWLKPILSLSA